MHKLILLIVGAVACVYGPPAYDKLMFDWWVLTSDINRVLDSIANAL